ncbi:peptidoglycan DD-metalloendopeptidase family protein [Aureimonas fodinaquatilis]|uniref:Peptidoglycan DD-metalloendopeptidase family protein n=1 Tax=Aureimonas fodinaquatilis TaxID=2565783 RepID=A0A5B0DSG8_9HYPH|nr:peptidoglycan DD-metalloendopeptidase family protein [Aureimonas fodinaquatilis]KAA0969754.1 peptidoglycan DD-metalloendopeptidase family protein [Aureimonas fodinaquatilis]
MRLQAELNDIRNQIRITQSTMSGLEAEAATLSEDGAAIALRLVETATEIRNAREQVVLLEKNLEANVLAEEQLTASLSDQRELLAGLLAALQRIGRSPPPALLVQPGDAVGALRSSVMLGSLLPGVETQTRILQADLIRLQELKVRIETDKRQYSQQLLRQKMQDARLTSLLNEKQRRQARMPDERVALEKRAEALANRADSMEALIAVLGTTSGSQATAALTPDGYNIGQLRHTMKKLPVNAAFSTLKGLLLPPVSGQPVVMFGEPGNGGRPTTGMIFRAAAGDLVTTPADAEIMYSGPFRSYGHLLILNAGDGYHIVMAGMARIDVNIKQFVLAGEPVARMGDRRMASAIWNDGLPDDEPALYVEFRKDGKPVDPALWWAKRQAGRTRNDT